MKHTLRHLLIAGAALAALAGAPAAIAAPGTPTVAGGATQASGAGTTLAVTTSSTINAGDLVLLIASSGSSQSPREATCLLAGGNSCPISWNGSDSGLPQAGQDPAGFSAQQGIQSDGRMDNSPIRARTYASYATSSIASGSTFNVYFGGAIGAKAATVVVIPSAEVSAAVTFGSAKGAGTSISPGATASLTTGQLILATSFISGGGSDSYTEDAGFTFLNQTAAGAWPAIRVAYKLTAGSGAVTYTLTNGSSRTWISSYQIAR